MLNMFTQKFLEKPVEFARQVSIHPPHGYTPVQQLIPNPNGLPSINYYSGLSKGTDINMSGRNLQYFDPAHRDKVTEMNGEFKHSKVEAPVGWMKLEPSPLLYKGGTEFSIEMADKAAIELEMATDSQQYFRDYERARLRGMQHTIAIPTWEHKDKIPIYFLPWRSKHMVSMTLPEYKEENVVSYGRGVEVDPLSPHIFFTAAINGCTVTVNGDPKQPVVSHLGIEIGSTPYGDNASGFWRDLVTAHQMQTGARGNLTHEVNNTMYVNNTGVSSGNRTENSEKYAAFLRNLPSTGPLTIDEVKPWGSVFGVRYGKLWTFYLQENASVTRYRMQKVSNVKKVSRLVPDRNFFGKKKSTYHVEEYNIEIVEDQRDYHNISVPVRVSPFYPKGPARVKFEPTFKRVN